MMNYELSYGCIGEHLPHSFSKEIHGQIGGYAYELKELTPEELPAFMAARSFHGINVTIPYKQAVIPFLDEIDETARAIGAVNTVVNRNGKLYGFNTDLDGLTRLIRRIGLDLSGKKVLIPGTGGTSRTAAFAAEQLGAREIRKISRTGRDGSLTYEEALRDHADAEIILNTTPCGMFPEPDAQPLPLDPFRRLEGIVDVIYNPLRSRLVLDARGRGIPAEGGLYMLVAQAVRASEHFTGKSEEYAHKQAYSSYHCRCIQYICHIRFSTGRSGRQNLSPANPKKAMLIRAAVTITMGNPLNGRGISLSVILSLRNERSTITIQYPAAVANP